MRINLQATQLKELKPRIIVCGVGGAGGNAVNNMIASGLSGVDFVVANTDAQALTSSRAERIIQMGLQVTEGLGAGSKPEVGKAAAEEALEEIRDQLAGAHMVSSPLAWAAELAPARRPSSPRRRVRWASSRWASSPSPFISRAAAA